MGAGPHDIAGALWHQPTETWHLMAGCWSNGGWQHMTSKDLVTWATQGAPRGFGGTGGLTHDDDGTIVAYAMTGGGLHFWRATDEHATTATCGQHKSPNHDRVPDCTHWDQGSCGNACCVAEIAVAGGVNATYVALRAYLESGGGDGGYAKASKRDASGHVSEDDQGDYPFGFDPPLPWRFTTSATHATSGGYVDALYLSVGETGSGSKVRMSSTSTINGALGDMGQNYKNLAFLCDGLGWSAPTIKFGCGYRS